MVKMILNMVIAYTFLYSSVLEASMMLPPAVSKPVMIKNGNNNPSNIKIIKNVHVKHYVSKEYFATGVGVAPKNTISPAQAMVLAQRAAMLDAYRQLSETLYGVTINGHDISNNSLVESSMVSSSVNAILRNAIVVKKEFKNGYAEVMLKVKVNIEV